MKALKHTPTTRPTNSTEIKKIIIISVKVFENLIKYAVVLVTFLTLWRLVAFGDFRKKTA